ncbi:D-serine/D-alanine/glycine transporter [Raoultella planticola]|uniref:D-serine/D-alanine/glycine transporter n=1 Tax=Raoultella planticola TaxID=575 RepID=A0A485D5T5_RAOPL|nr:D-serine/D-alanine/glycine transporter [Raoultella planticola]
MPTASSAFCRATTRIPVRSLLFSCFCMLSGTLLLFLVPNVMTLFTIVSTLAAIMVVFSWGMISGGLSGVPPQASGSASAIDV